LWLITGGEAGPRLHRGKELIIFHDVDTEEKVGDGFFGAIPCREFDGWFCYCADAVVLDGI
jgi:hypothetical protein